MKTDIYSYFLIIMVEWEVLEFVELTCNDPNNNTQLTGYI